MAAIWLSWPKWSSLRVANLKGVIFGRIMYPPSPSVITVDTWEVMKGGSSTPAPPPPPPPHQPQEKKKKQQQQQQQNKKKKNRLDMVKFKVNWWWNVLCQLKFLKPLEPIH